MGGYNTLTPRQARELVRSAPRVVHCVGVGGAGMSALAKLLVEQGHCVTGCDCSLNGETGRLRQMGVAVSAGHDRGHITPATELVVYSAAVGQDHAELEAAREMGVPCVARGTMLAALMDHAVNIVVSGTHGKTTTSAMVAQVLTRSDCAPTYCVGATVPVLGDNARYGGGKYFVAEACESDGTLVGYTPEYAICLNIEPEHLDYHGTLDRLVETFACLCRSTLRAVLLSADCARTRALAAQARRAITFGLSETADYRAVNVRPTARGSRFEVVCRGERLGELELVIPGQQNVHNALAVVALADELGMEWSRVQAALREFTGARRRFERKWEGNGIVVADDYAHHPTEIRATLAAARGLGFRRIRVAFQPHRYTRTKLLWSEFLTAFRDADEVWLTEIYAAGEAAIPGVTGAGLAAAMADKGQPVRFEVDCDRLAVALAEGAQAGDLILTMGAGDIYRVAEKVVERLRAGSGLEDKRRMHATSVESDLRALVSAGSRVRSGEPMSKHTSLRVGGPAEFWVEPKDERDLARVLHYCHVRQIPVTVVGRGTNLLVRDGGIDGVVIHLDGDEFTKVWVEGDRIFARAGARLRTVVNAARRACLGGLEFLEGIPGSVGGALRMNAGAMGHQTFEVVERLRYMSMAGEVYEAEARTVPVGYRSCPVLQSHIALEATLVGTPTELSRIDAVLRLFESKRWSSQPAKPSAGCIFKNPPQIPAGKLIDELGLKGLRVGGACISERHGNFIVNEGGATARDILQLVELIRERARRERGIELEPEVMILGKDDHD
ncbi:MAG: UDP-N-acetylmuramate--L-alanine ligase [Verrucomicrobiae bacterium]|nr:UDP-N-acetylmuramate--L-alanine ligase [Verrucomicrobiae bacterium]